MKRIDAKPLGDLIKLFIKTLDIEEQINISKIYSAWDNVVDERISTRTISRNFRNGKLYCKLSSASAKAEIYPYRSEIKNKINKILGSEIVKDLILQ